MMRVGVPRSIMLLPSPPISTPDDTLPVDREGGDRDEIDEEGLDDYEDEEVRSLSLTLPTYLLIHLPTLPNLCTDSFIYLPYLPQFYP